jgi:hypothetical protein
VLDKRGWVLANPEWFMDEVVFYRENQKYMNAAFRIAVWKFDDKEGKAVIK